MNTCVPFRMRNLEPAAAQVNRFLESRKHGIHGKHGIGSIKSFRCIQCFQRSVINDDQQTLISNQIECCSDLSLASYDDRAGTRLPFAWSFPAHKSGT
jgi:hypothetical protein